MQASCEPQTSASRSGNRVFIQLPIEVYGSELTGLEFCDKTMTRCVSRNGGSILLSRHLGPDQELTIKLKRGKEAVVRVVGQVAEVEGTLIYGIAFTQPLPDFWDITFHDGNGSAAGKVLLECIACRRREDVNLDEIELDVFELKKRLHRPCRVCRVSTIWGPVPAGAEPEESSPSASPPAPALPPASPKPRERRRNNRTRIERIACIRQVMKEDVVSTIDASRHGVRFRSSRPYQLNTWVEIAMPYIPGAANIFTSARIAWAKREKEGVWEYGAEYRKYRNVT